MTNRAEFERLLDVYGFRCERFGQDLSTHARAQVVSAFAALAGAPVADVPLTHRCANCGAVFQGAGCPSCRLAAPVASAPVAGEAVYTLRVRGAIQAWTPTAAAFSIPDGEHQLFLSPAAPQASECECSRKSKAVSDSEAQL